MPWNYIVKHLSREISLTSYAGYVATGRFYCCESVQNLKLGEIHNLIWLVTLIVEVYFLRMLSIFV